MIRLLKFRAFKLYSVNSHRVVDVHDDGRIGFGLGQGGEVKDGAWGAEGGVVRPSGAEGGRVEGGKDMVAEAEGGEEERADKVGSESSIL